MVHNKHIRYSIVHHGIQTTMQVDIHMIKKYSPQCHIHELGIEEATY